MSSINFSVLISAIVSFSPSLVALLRFIYKLYHSKSILDEKNKTVKIRIKDSDTIKFKTISPNMLKLDENDSYRNVIESILKPESTTEHNNHLPENTLKSINVE